uniref:Uncharacterized protein n=1 Tax=Apteryx owenii TaxID=8824 RepID=A0A8B9QBX6_APTOW
MLARAVPKPRSLRRYAPSPDGQAAGCRRVHVAAGELRSAPAPATAARPFNQLPGNWKAGWLNLYRFWFPPHPWKWDLLALRCPA